jgi:hypothetical protein
MACYTVIEINHNELDHINGMEEFGALIAQCCRMPQTAADRLDYAKVRGVRVLYRNHERITTTSESHVWCAYDVKYVPPAKVGHRALGLKRLGWLRRQIEAQREWIAEHGGDEAGYVFHYGSKDSPSHYGDGGEAIYEADRGELTRLEEQMYLLAKELGA